MNRSHDLLHRCIYDRLVGATESAILMAGVVAKNKVTDTALRMAVDLHVNEPVVIAVDEAVSGRKGR